MGRAENVSIFEHTMDLCRTNSVLVEAIRTSGRKQTVILEADTLEPVTPRFDTPANIFVTRNRTYEAAEQYHGQKTCVGAYGCGAFQNPPDVVAKALKQVAFEYRYI